MRRGRQSNGERGETLDVCRGRLVFARTSFFVTSYVYCGWSERWWKNKYLSLMIAVANVKPSWFARANFRKANRLKIAFELKEKLLRNRRKKVKHAKWKSMVLKSMNERRKLPRDFPSRRHLLQITSKRSFPFYVLAETSQFKWRSLKNH